MIVVIVILENFTHSVRDVVEIDDTCAMARAKELLNEHGPGYHARIIVPAEKTG